MKVALASKICDFLWEHSAFYHSIRFACNYCAFLFFAHSEGRKAFSICTALQRRENLPYLPSLLPKYGTQDYSKAGE